MNHTDTLQTFLFQDAHVRGQIAHLDNTFEIILKQHAYPPIVQYFWEYAVKLGETVKEDELLQLDNETLLQRLYHETEVVLYDSLPARFQCKCSEEKMKQVIKMLGEADAQRLLSERGKIDISCDFCNQHFSFDAIDTAMLFRS